MIGPYADDLVNVLPNAVEGVGVPVDPLAFAGLLGESFAIPLFSSSFHLRIGNLEAGTSNMCNVSMMTKQNKVRLIDSSTCFL